MKNATDSAPSPPVDLCDLSFDDHFVRSLPADPSRVNQPRQVRDACYSWVSPTPVNTPRLLAISPAFSAIRWNRLFDMHGCARPIPSLY